MRTAAGNGITHIRDLLDADGNVKAADELGLSKVTYDRIIGALPDAWCLLINDGAAPPCPSEWFMASVIMPASWIFQVVSVADNVISMRRFSLNIDSSFNSDDPTEIDVPTACFDFIRAHVTEHRHGYLCHGPQQLLELDPALLSVDQLVGTRMTRVPLLKTTVRGCAKALTATKASTPNFSVWDTHLLQTTPIRWKRIINWIWSPHRDRKINDWLWKLIHRALPLGFNRRRFSDDINCACGTDVVESIEHVFGACAVFSALWAWFRNAWHEATKVVIGDSLYDRLFCSVPTFTRPLKQQDNKMYWILFGVAHSELLYCWWLHRCDAVMDDQLDAFTPTAIAARFRHRLTVHVGAIMDLARYTGLQSWTDPFIGAMVDLPV
jgi:hypothetical protein